MRPVLLAIAIALVGALTSAAGAEDKNFSVVAPTDAQWGDLQTAVQSLAGADHAVVSDRQTSTITVKDVDPSTADQIRTLIKEHNRRASRQVTLIYEVFDFQPRDHGPASIAQALSLAGAL